MIALLLLGCLERTTGTSTPLDPRFLSGSPSSGGTAGGSPDGGGSHTHHVVEHIEDAAPPGPFEDVEGERVTLSGVISSETTFKVEMDLRAVDATADGGVRQLGKLFLEGTGPWSIEAPKGFGVLLIDAYQDLAADGPGDDDPFAGRRVEVGDSPLTDLDFKLVVGGRAKSIASMAPSVSPFPDHKGAWTTLKGLIESPNDGAVALDLRLPDPSSQTGDRYLGKVQLAGTGAFELAVPRGLGELTVEAFQDLSGDGPSVDDPYARAKIQVGDDESMDVSFTLVAGAYKSSAQPTGQPSGAAGPGGGLNPSAAPMFKDLGARPLTIAGTITLEGDAAPLVDLDVFSADPMAPGGRRFLGKLKVAPGPFSFQVPRGYGALELEAFVDKDGDGPTPSDPFGACSGNPVRVEDEDIRGLVIEVKRRG